MVRVVAVSSEALVYHERKLHEKADYVIDPAGDIALVIRSGHTIEHTGQTVIRFTEIRASTAVLKRNSLYFSAMLHSGRFREGHVLAATQAQGRMARIDLGEGDGDGILLLCQILHDEPPWAFLEIWRETAPLKLGKLARTADYYQCLDGVAQVASSWLREYLKEQYIPDESMGYLLLAAWMFKDADHFKSMTMSLVLDSSTPLNEYERLIPQEEGVQIPPIVFESLEKLRKSMSKSIYDGLYKHIPQNVFKTHWSPLAFYAEDYINTYITRLKCFDLHWDSGLPIAKVMINLDRLESTYGTELDAEFRPRLDAQLGKIKDKRKKPMAPTEIPCPDGDS